VILVQTKRNKPSRTFP